MVSKIFTRSCLSIVAATISFANTPVYAANDEARDQGHAADMPGTHPSLVPVDVLPAPEADEDAGAGAGENLEGDEKDAAVEAEKEGKAPFGTRYVSKGSIIKGLTDVLTDKGVDEAEAKAKSLENRIIRVFGDNLKKFIPVDDYGRGLEALKDDILALLNDKEQIDVVMASLKDAVASHRAQHYLKRIKDADTDVDERLAVAFYAPATERRLGEVRRQIQSLETQIEEKNNEIAASNHGAEVAAAKGDVERILTDMKFKPEDHADLKAAGVDALINGKIAQMRDEVLGADGQKIDGPLPATKKPATKHKKGGAQTREAMVTKSLDSKAISLALKGEFNIVSPGVDGAIRGYVQKLKEDGIALGDITWGTPKETDDIKAARTHVVNYLEGLSNRVSVLTQHREALRAACEEFERLSAQDDPANQLRDEVAQLQKDLTEKQKIQAKLDSKLVAARQGIETSKPFVEVREKVEETEGALTEKEQQVAQLRGQVEDLRRTLNEKETALQELAGKEAEVVKLQEEVAALKNSESKLKRELSAQEDLYDELNEAKVVGEKTAEQAFADNRRLGTRVTALENALQELGSKYPNDTSLQSLFVRSLGDFDDDDYEEEEISKDDSEGEDYEGGKAQVEKTK